MRLSKKGHTRNRRFLGTPSDRKAQMEIVGLVVIVILITLGMLFFAMFAVKESPQKKVFTRKGLAASTMTALMKTTVSEPDCSENIVKLQMEKDVLDDCAKHFRYETSYYTCKGMHSCNYFRLMAEDLLNQTLGGWNKNYELQVWLNNPDGEDEEIILPRIAAGGGCEKKERDTSRPFPLSTDAGTVNSILYLCD